MATMAKKRDNPKPRGRPRKAGSKPRFKVSWRTVTKLCRMQCTLEEIAAELGCSEDTVERAIEREHGIKFREYYAKARLGGFVSIRRHQMQLAERGDKTMLIWLGKQWLGQRDVTALEHSAPGGGAIQVQHFVDSARAKLTSVLERRIRAADDAGERDSKPAK